MEQAREAVGISRSLGAMRHRFSSDSDEDKRVKARDLGQDAVLQEIATHPMDRISFHLRNYWLAKLAPSDVVISQDRDGHWVTGRKKRVFANAGSYDKSSHEWLIQIPPKSFEVWVLLCLDERFWLEDFIVPQKYFSQDFAHAKAAAAAQKSPILVTVRQQGGQYTLSVRHGHPVDITALRGNYTPLE